MPHAGRRAGSPRRGSRRWRRGRARVGPPALGVCASARPVQRRGPPGRPESRLPRRQPARESRRRPGVRPGHSPRTRRHRRRAPPRPRWRRRSRRRGGPRGARHVRMPAVPRDRASAAALMVRGAHPWGVLRRRPDGSVALDDRGAERAKPAGARALLRHKRRCGAYVAGAGGLWRVLRLTDPGDGLRDAPRQRTPATPGARRQRTPATPGGRRQHAPATAPAAPRTPRSIRSRPRRLPRPGRRRAPRPTPPPRPRAPRRG